MVGLGRWATLLYNFLVEVRGAEVVVCHDADEGVAQAFSRVFDVPLAGSPDRICADPSVGAVIVATSNDSHAPLAREFLLAGKDVFVEKPIATSLADADELIRIARERQRILMVGHNSRRYPAVRRMKELIAEGRIGRVVTLEATYSFPNLEEICKPTWRNDPQKCPGGPLLQLGIHHADNLLYLAGPVERVYGELLQPPPGARVPAGGRLLLRFSCGAIGCITSDYCTSPEMFRIVARGEAGWMEADGETTLRLGDDRGVEQLSVGGVPSLQAELEEFVECVESRRTPETGGWVGREALRVILAGLEAARAGRPVELAENVGKE